MVAPARVFGVRRAATELHAGPDHGRRRPTAAASALLVDELLGQQQVVIKNLETNYRRVDGVSGATILGDGRVALILDVPGA